MPSKRNKDMESDGGKEHSPEQAMAMTYLLHLSPYLKNPKNDIAVDNVVVAMRNCDIDPEFAREVAISEHFTQEQFQEAWDRDGEWSDFGLPYLQRIAVKHQWARNYRQKDPFIIIERNLQGFQEYTEMRGLKFRWNERREREEIQIPSGFWMPIQDYHLSVIRTDLEQSFGEWRSFNGESAIAPIRLSASDTKKYIEAVATSMSVDEVRDWVLAKRGLWDGHPRLVNWLRETVGAHPDVDEVDEEHYDAANSLITWVSQWIVCAMVRRTMDPGCQIDVMPVLYGPQRIGKSHVCRLLCPQRDWFTSNVTFSDSVKQIMEKSRGKLVCEVEEMQANSHRNLGKMKSIITGEVDTERMAYAHYTNETARRWVMIGTANDEATGILPQDPSGNLRFVLVKCRQIMDGEERTAYFQHNLDQMIAEAWDLLDNRNFQLQMPEHLREAQFRTNAANEQVDLHLEGIIERIWNTWYNFEPQDIAERCTQGLRPAELIYWSRAIELGYDTFGEPKYTMANAEALYRSSRMEFARSLTKFFKKRRVRVCNPETCRYENGQCTKGPIRVHAPLERWFPKLLEEI